MRRHLLRSVTAAILGISALLSGSLSADGLPVYRLKVIGGPIPNAGPFFFRSKNGPVTTLDGAVVGTANATAFINIIPPPGTEFPLYPTFVNASDGTRDISIGSLVSADQTLRYTAAYDFASNTPLDAAVQVVSNSLLLVRLQPVYLTPLNGPIFNNTFRPTEDRTEIIVGDTAVAVRKNSEWYLEGDDGQLTRLGENTSISFASQTHSGIVNLAKKTGTNDFHGAMVWCRPNPALAANCFFKGIDRAEGIFGRADALPPSPLGSRSGLRLTHANPARFPKFPCPSEEPPAPRNLIAAHDSSTGILRFAWDSAPCATGYKIIVTSTTGRFTIPVTQKETRLEVPNQPGNDQVTAFAVVSVGVLGQESDPSEDEPVMRIASTP